MTNVAVIVGRFVADPELKTTTSGTEVTSFTIAVDRNYVKEGEERQCDFVDCIAWRATAKFITKWFKKGDLIAIDGSMQTRSYEDKNGNKRKATEIVVANANFCGGKKKDTEGFEPSPAAVYDGDDVPSDDLPF